MAVILIGGEKGGTGKSTIASNLSVWLAHRDKDVLLVDTDPQGSVTSWHATRSERKELPTVHCVQKTGDVASAVQDLSGRYDEVVIDAGGRDSKELRSAMLVATRLYIPIKASQFDLWTMQRMDELIDLAHTFNSDLKAFAVISMAPTNPMINETQEAKEMLSEFEHLQLAKTIIRERKAYRDAVVEGLGVRELTNQKARVEMDFLGAEVYGNE
ncbi:hypothetical protein ES702_06563 [subsurface metagenome]